MNKKNKSDTPEKRYFINDVFTERKFLLVREFANRKGLVYVDELQEHIESLKNMRGIGNKKLELILKKINNPEEPIEINPSPLKEIEWEMPIERVFRGSYHALKEYCQKTGRKKLKDLKDITIEELRSINWSGNAIYKSLLKKLERYGIKPKPIEIDKLDIEKHSMAVLTDDIKLNKAYQNAHVKNLKDFLLLGREGRLAIKNYGEVSELLLKDLLKEHGIELDSFEDKYLSRFPERNLNLKPDEILPKIKEFLTQREYFIVTNRALEKKTLEEIGVNLELTRERIRQIEKKAIIRTNIYIGPIIKNYAEEIYKTISKNDNSINTEVLCEKMQCTNESLKLICYLAGYKDVKIGNNISFIISYEDKEGNEHDPLVKDLA